MVFFSGVEKEAVLLQLIDNKPIKIRRDKKRIMRGGDQVSKTKFNTYTNPLCTLLYIDAKLLNRLHNSKYQ